MAVSRKKLGGNYRIYKGTILIGCADSADESINVDKIPTKCQTLAGINTFDPGDLTYSLSFKGIYTTYTSPDAATNISADAIWTDAAGGTEVTVVLGGPTTGDAIKTYVGYIESVKLGHKVGDNSTYDVTMWANSCTPGTRP